jgi:sulfonate transport system ATP-binding protein
MTKIITQEELPRICREERVTMVIVTHDLEKAIDLADRVLVLPKDVGSASDLRGRAAAD